ncbi:endonuclease/exonuclease/phosphatase family protein [Panacibacter sp. DH6]|uniref:Endonuclease/exonuclease/phosphatase family protein n=1 Tax=Panacibacter microcysteis TaxID=2793269 RepID=A0A931GYB0_9BACT|nr:endonuclease/exonuclease/phosphatase family protein [Panacibacter microcysteis]MBG9375087.1 endonuclease/exonuclease/phosphatase family protein [Panacibacter microcysteis]
MELSFLFWNTGGKKCIDEIYNLVDKYNIDVLILAENSASPSDIILKLNSVTTLFFPPHPFSFCEKIKIYSKFHYNYITPIEESARITVRNLELPILNNLNLIGLHFGDKGNFSSESQSEMASELRSLINSVEKKQKHSRTMIIGDFNMNPFETGLVKANGLHAVMSHKIAKQTSRQVQSKTYEYFYNPMWSLFGDLQNEVSGSYYYRRAELVNYQWNIFDQVLLRPLLINNLDKSSLKIVTHDGIKKLLNKGGVPNRKLYSDHLPITFKLTF